MGWKAGQGLGANNQGPTEFVKVKKKDDNKGLGFKDNGEEWLKTTSEFNELLDNLKNGLEDQSNEGLEENTTSLEDRSKNSKSRVHYHKFTRGKDLSKYSEKDLASIVGPDVVKQKSVKNHFEDYTVNQVLGGTSTEYFNSKKNVVESHDPQYFSEEIQSSENTFEKKSSKRKERNRGSSQNHENLNQDCVSKSNDEDITHDCNKIRSKESIDEEIETKIKKKKKKDIKQLDETPSQNFGSESTYGDNDTCINYNKKKRKKCRVEENEAILNSDTAGLAELEPPLIVSSKKKSKKKKKPEPDIEGNHIEEDIENNVHYCEESNSALEKTSNKKKRKEGESSIGQETIFENRIDQDEELNLTSKVPSRKKRKLNGISETDQPDKQNFAEEVFETSKKKKRQNKASTNDEALDCNLDNSFENKTNSTKKYKKMICATEGSEKNCEIKEDSFSYIVESDIGNYPKNKNKKSKKQEKKTLILEENTMADKPLVQPQQEIKKKKKIKIVDHGCESKTDSIANNLYECNGNEDKNSFVNNVNKTTDKDEESEKIPEKSSKPLNIKEEIKEGKSVTNEKENESKSGSDQCIKVLGRPTRLRKISRKCETVEKYETGDFISLSSNTIDTVSKCGPLKNDQQESNDSKLKIYVDSDEYNTTAKKLISYEYRLLRDKMNELKLTVPEIKVITSKHLCLAEKKRMKMWEKIKQFKSLLPKSELSDVAKSVEIMGKNLETEVRLMNDILQIETKFDLATEPLLQYVSETTASNETNVSQEIVDNTVETIKILSKELNGLLKRSQKMDEDVANLEGEGFIKAEVVEGKKDYFSKKEEGEADVGVHKNSLQYRTTEKLKMLSNLIDLLLQGKVSEFIVKLKIVNQNKKTLTVKSNPLEKSTDKRAFLKGRGQRYQNYSPQVVNHQKRRGVLRNFGRGFFGNTHKMKHNHSESFESGGVSLKVDNETTKDNQTFNYETRIESHFQKSSSKLTHNYTMEENESSICGRGFMRGTHGSGLEHTDTLINGKERSLTITYNTTPTGLDKTNLIKQNETFSCESRRGRGFGRGHAVMRPLISRRGGVTRSSHVRFGENGEEVKTCAPLGGWGSLNALSVPGNGQSLYTLTRGGFSYGGRGRGVNARPRGRISQNNFDVKTFAEKCKSQNIVPELGFNGVDLKVISGYAANVLKKTQSVSEVAKKSTKIDEVVVEKNVSCDSTS